MTRVLTSAGQAETSAAERERADRTVRRPDGANGNHPAAQTGKIIETGPRFTPGSGGRTYVADRRTRRRRGRLVGFFVFVPLWVLSLVPVARESMDGRVSADAVLVYLAVGAISLGVAAAIRGVYVVLTERRFLSPWVFVIAAAVALAGYSVQSAGEEVAPIAGAQALESSAE